MATEDTAAADTQSAGSGGSGSGSNKLITVLTVVNLLATLGMVGILVISFKKETTQPAVSDIVSHAPASEGGKGGADSAHGSGQGDAKGAAGEGAAKSPVEFGKMVELDQFTVNLSTPGSVTPKFVRVNISLELPSTDAEGEIKHKMPQVRNTIIDLFNSKRASDLATAEGRDYVKEEILNALNSFMHTGKVKGVFFTSFAVSS